MGNRLIRRPEVLAKTSLKSSDLDDKIKKHKFPPPVPISERRVAWLESEVDDWIASKVADREAGVRVDFWQPHKRKRNRQAKTERIEAAE